MVSIWRPDISGYQISVHGVRRRSDDFKNDQPIAVSKAGLDTEKEECVMNENEKIESCIAICKCCLLAQAMKDCALCRFNIGLAEQVILVEPIALPLNNEKVALFTLA